MSTFVVYCCGYRRGCCFLVGFIHDADYRIQASKEFNYRVQSGQNQKEVLQKLVLHRLPSSLAN